VSDEEPVHNREWIAEHLERAEFVDWDRFVVGSYHTGEQYVDVYGWIDRDDEYKDFVWTRFRPDNGPDPTMEFTTSSDDYSEELMRIWFGEESLDDHNECRRVEHAFDVENAIELGEQATLVTDGGVDRDDAGVDGAKHKGFKPDECLKCGSDDLNWSYAYGYRTSA